MRQTAERIWQQLGALLRILDIGTFREEYDHFWRRGSATSNDVDEAFECKLLMAIALGSRTLQVSNELEGSETSQEQASGWITHVKAWFARKMGSGVKNKMDLAQISCLLAIARCNTHREAISYGDNDPTLLGVKLNLHRDPRKLYPTMPLKEVEMRRRLWAIMIELSLHLCLDEGLPPALTSESEYSLVSYLVLMFFL
jgi:hypothetical protein